MKKIPSVEELLIFKYDNYSYFLLEEFINYGEIDSILVKNKGMLIDVFDEKLDEKICYIFDRYEVNSIIKNEKSFALLTFNELLKKLKRVDNQNLKDYTENMTREK